MRVQVDGFAPVSAVGELAVRAASVHPFVAYAGVVIGQRKVRRGVAQGFADGHAFGVQRVGHAADGRLRAFVMDVPLVEMLQGPGIHQDERRVNDGARVHQRAGQPVFNGFDAGIGLAQQRQRVVGQTAGKHAGGQARGVAADHHRVAVLARQIGQGAGFRVGDAGGVAGVFLRARKKVAAEGAGRQEHHLVVLQQRRQGGGQCVMGGAGQGNDQHLRVGHRVLQGVGQGNVTGTRAQANLAGAAIVGDRQRAGIAQALEGGAVAAPPAHLVAFLR
ncbi:hypothetical protein D3C73_974830 [compost metagenome]